MGMESCVEGIAVSASCPEFESHVPVRDGRARCTSPCPLTIGWSLPDMISLVEGEMRHVFWESKCPAERRHGLIDWEERSFKETRGMSPARKRLCSR